MGNLLLWDVSGSVGCENLEKSPGSSSSILNLEQLVVVNRALYGQPKKYWHKRAAPKVWNFKPYLKKTYWSYNLFIEDKYADFLIDLFNIVSNVPTYHWSPKTNRA